MVRDSSGNDNPAPDGDGLGVFGSHHLRIFHNSFRRNGQLGMHIEDSTDNLIEGNRFSRNDDMGILMEAEPQSGAAAIAALETATRASSSGPATET